MARQTEWKAYGDPRDKDGHFRPKQILKNDIDQRGYSIAEFARMMGTDASTLHRMLSGKQYMSNELVLRASALLGIDFRRTLEWSTRDTTAQRAIRQAIIDVRESLSGHITDVTEPDSYGNVEEITMCIDASNGIPKINWISTDEICYEYQKRINIEEWRTMQLEELDAFGGDWRDFDKLASDAAAFIIETYAGDGAEILEGLAPVLQSRAKARPGKRWSKQVRKCEA